MENKTSLSNLIKEKEEVDVSEIIMEKKTYPCDLVFCASCNSSYDSDWFWVNNKRYCWKCIVKLVKVLALSKGIEVAEKQKKMFEELIDNYDKYPSDIFPFMNKLELRKIDVFMKETFGFSLDRLSAHLMRLAQENIKKELKLKLAEQLEVKE